MALKEMLGLRLALIESFTALTSVLARLAHDGSNYATMAWDRLPASPPVWTQSQVAIALYVARDGGPLSALALTEAAPEWLAYQQALWAFSQMPLYGPPPMQVPPSTVAAHVEGARIVMSVRHNGI
jgi:hypothetical protein